MSNTIVYPHFNGVPAHVICAMDYAVGDPAQADIEGLAKNWFGMQSHVTWFTVDDFSSIEVGFNLATRQIVQGNRIHPFTVFLGNAAPRKKETKNLEAAPFVVFRLKNGVFVFTTLNDDYDEISLIDLDSIDGPIHQLKLQTDGTQFRSLFLPEYAAKYCLSLLPDGGIDTSDVVDTTHDFLPDAREVLKRPRPPRIIHVDNFGNIKLSLTKVDMNFPTLVGTRSEVEIDSVLHSFVHGKHLGDCKNASDLVLHPGSSISHKGTHMEITLVGESAASQFESVHGLARCGFRPKSGTQVQIRR